MQGVRAREGGLMQGVRAREGGLMRVCVRVRCGLSPTRVTVRAAWLRLKQDTMVSLTQKKMRCKLGERKEVG